MAIKMLIHWPSPEGADARDVEVYRAAALREIREMGVDVRETESDVEAAAGIAEAEIFYGRRLSPEWLPDARNLKWMQATSAGLDGFFYPELRESAITITNIRGVFHDVIADHVFALILSFARGIHTYARQQLSAEWKRDTAPMIFLGGTTVGLVGLGGIGLGVARRARAFDMRVLAVDPAPKGTPENVEEIRGPEDLNAVLGRSDFVVISVPHTPETEGMIHAAALRAMKPTAVLINVGRGKVVDLNALTATLASGGLAGAGLDVFEEEPLPADHPLWRMDNVLITPHVAWRSSYPYIEERRMNLLVENTRRYCNGEPLLNVVDKQKGYVVQVNP